MKVHTAAVAIVLVIGGLVLDDGRRDLLRGAGARQVGRRLGMAHRQAPEPRQRENRDGGGNSCSEVRHSLLIVAGACATPWKTRTKAR